MKATILKTESRLLGQNIIQLTNWQSVDEIIASEPDIISKHRPAFIYCQTDATNITAIQLLEDHGYRFNEFRIKTMMHTEDCQPGTRAYYPLYAEPIGEKKDLEKGIAILLSNKQDDRFSNDPSLGEAFSRKRIEANLRKSFRSGTKEFLLGLYNGQRNELVAFRSGAFISGTEAHYYQYGVHPDSNFEHTANILEAFTIEYLLSRNIEIIYAVSTGFNTPEINRLLKNYEFKVVTTQVLMRKGF